ncbi:uncharacterized protein LOC143563133 [Bidens hawaiensis]|uniref:uncharacterized protein LOC143563133 n=1 Tax=Bidens hawaiensis TaxID=980011 RepID=UPI00404AFFBE
MLSDSKLPLFFWGEAIGASCFIQNCVLINKRLKKTPYEVYYTTKPQVNYFKTFGCPCTLLHTGAQRDPKFTEKANECYFDGYASNKTAYRVYNKKARLILESFNVDWKELNVTDARTGPDWLFDFDNLFNQFRGMFIPQPASTQVPSSSQELVLMQSLINSMSEVDLSVRLPAIPAPPGTPPTPPPPVSSQVVINLVPQVAHQAVDSTEMVELEDVADTDSDDSFNFADNVEQHQTELVADLQVAPSVVESVATPPSTDGTVQVAATVEEHAAGDSDHTAITPINPIVVHMVKISGKNKLLNRMELINLTLFYQLDDLEGAPRIFYPTKNLSVNLQAEPVTIVEDIPQLPIHRHHPTENIIVEPKDYKMDLRENSWVEAMQEELLQFKKLQVWRLVKMPPNKKPNGTKWVFRNKKNDMGREGLDYDETYAPVARLSSFSSLCLVHEFQSVSNVKTDFLYGKVKEEIYVKQPPCFEDPDRPNHVYRLGKALYGMHQAPRAWYATLAEHLLNIGYRRGVIDETLFIKKIKGDQILV